MSTQYVYPKDVIGARSPGDPWRKANGIDRERARFLAWHYGESSCYTDAELVDLFGCREWEVRQARWLAVLGGLIVRAGKGWKPAPQEGGGSND